MSNLREIFGLDDLKPAENTVSFEIYPHDPDTDLSTLRTQLLQHLLPYLSDYIWQRDRFDLIPSNESQPPWLLKSHSSRKTKQTTTTTTPSSSSSTPPPFLWASIDFGDNIEDEWFIVWILKYLTHAFPSITARVWDNDGEFLLIEAAYHIPRWLKPETAQNRVWIHAGNFHIVPQPRYRGDPLLSPTQPRYRGDPLVSPTPTLEQALHVVRSSSSSSRSSFINTMASDAFHQALNIRLGKYPEESKRQMHLTIARIPLPLAFILHQQPQLIAPIVEAFYYRTPDDVKAAGRMKYLPITSSSDFVTVNVQFTRCLYAQMALQEYTGAPKGWKQHAAMTHDDNGGGEQQQQQQPSFYNHDHAVDLGIKIAAGFEMVMSNPSRYGAASSSSSNDNTVVDVDGWKKYQSNLQSLGYYKHTLPGSKEYLTLEEQAKAKYATTAKYTIASRSLSQAPAAVAQKLLSSLLNMNSNGGGGGGGNDNVLEDFRQQQTRMELLLPPKDDAWLRQGASEIDAELDRREAEIRNHQSSSGGSKKTQPNNNNSNSNNRKEGELEDMEQLTSKFKKFMEMMSGFEGADFDDNSDNYNSNSSSNNRGMGRNFDESAFLEELGKVFEMAEGEYGDTEGGKNWDAASSSTTEGSSFFDGDDTDKDDDSDDEGPLTATDSDDDDDDNLHGPNITNTNNNNLEFYEAYASILSNQLATESSKLKHSFVRATAPTDATPSDNMEMRDVDVDINLVEGLLQSHAEQAGLPGPASNLAGLLGLKLPSCYDGDGDGDGEDEDGQQQRVKKSDEEEEERL